MEILINSQNEEWAIRMIISADILSYNHKHSLSFTCLQINNKTYNKQMSKIGKCRRWSNMAVFKYLYVCEINQ